MNTKICSRCGIEKELSEFHRAITCKDGYSTYCEQCYHKQIIAYGIKYRSEHRDQIKIRHVKRYIEHCDEIKARCAKYRSNHRDQMKTYLIKYYDSHRDYWREYVARRRAVKLNATPPWVDRKELQKIYAEAAKRRRAGENVHVDHIVPLRGKNVCGLHVPWNLQIIPAHENLSKHNSYKP